MASHNITVFLKTITGSNIELSLPATSTVAHLKTMVADSENVASNLQRIIFSGKELSNDTTLESHSVNDRSQLFVVLRVAQIMVKTLQDRVFIIAAEPKTTVRDLKQKLNAQDSSWEVARQRIIFKSEELPDSALITQCGLDEVSPTVHVVMRLPALGTARRGSKQGTTVAKVEGNATGKEHGTVAVAATQVDKDMGEPSEQRDVLNEFDDLLGVWPSTGRLDMDTTWNRMEEESHSADVPPSLQWEDSLTLPDLDSDQQFQAVAGFNSPTGAPPTAATVANIKTEETGKSERDWLEVGEELPMPSMQGRAMDLSKVDDKLRKRLLKNRKSAERSRQKKQARVETLEFELSCCRSENEHLRGRVAMLEAQMSGVRGGGRLGAMPVPLTALRRQMSASAYKR